MSLNINLLPDVRQAKLRDKRNRRLAILVMTIAVIATAGLLVVGFLIIQGQYLTINKVSDNIKNKQQQIAAYPNVKTILSLQARLASLPSLYAQRQIMTNLYNDLSGIEPGDVAFTSIAMDGSNQLSIAANGKSYLAAARLAKALEADNVTVGNGANASNQPFFSDVQLSAVSFSSGVTSYSVTAKVNLGVIHGQ